MRATHSNGSVPRYQGRNAQFGLLLVFLAILDAFSLIAGSGAVRVRP